MILNVPVRIIMNMTRYTTNRITHKAIELHFSLVRAVIEVKICLLAHKSLQSSEPRYIKNPLQPALISSLRISICKRLVEPFLSRQFTMERSYCHCVPRLCNKLPFLQRTIDNLSNFKKKLKTYFFSKKLTICKSKM